MSFNEISDSNAAAGSDDARIGVMRVTGWTPCPGHAGMLCSSPGGPRRTSNNLTSWPALGCPREVQPSMYEWAEEAVLGGDHEGSA